MKVFSETSLVARPSTKLAIFSAAKHIWMHAKTDAKNSPSAAMDFEFLKLVSRCSGSTRPS